MEQEDCDLVRPCLGKIKSIKVDRKDMKHTWEVLAFEERKNGNELSIEIKGYVIILLCSLIKKKWLDANMTFLA